MDKLQYILTTNKQSAKKEQTTDTHDIDES